MAWQVVKVRTPHWGGTSAVSVEHAAEMAKRYGWHTYVEDNRMHFEKDGNSASTIITDGMISKFSFKNFTGHEING
jgi:hypothetical protein